MEQGTRKKHKVSLFSLRRAVLALSASMSQQPVSYEELLQLEPGILTDGPSAYWLTSSIQAELQHRDCSPTELYPALEEV